MANKPPGRISSAYRRNVAMLRNDGKTQGIQDLFSFASLKCVLDKLAFFDGFEDPEKFQKKKNVSNVRSFFIRTLLGEHHFENLKILYELGGV